jgi:hypothetical protein
MRRPTALSLVAGAAGITAGILGGIMLTAVSAGGAEPLEPATPPEAAHVPPPMTLPGEPVRLRFAIVCSPRADGRECEGSGELFLRSGQSGTFSRIPLLRGEDSREGRYYADVPGDVAQGRAGFSYYAVLREDARGEELTLPSGGAAAPHRSFPMGGAVAIELGAHTFGRTNPAAARVVDARWGSDAGEAGVAGTRELGFVGPSAFDVTSAGDVVLLDQVNARLQRWANGRVSTTPLEVSGGLADLAVEPDGTIDVLEPPNRTTPAAVLRRFRTDGTLKHVQHLADRTWSKLVLGPAGPLVHEQPSELWMPGAADKTSQRRGARPGRAISGGREVLIQRVDERELRVGELAGQKLLRSWRITSGTPLGEVQLAEQLGSRILVVVKTFTETRGEYVVLSLGPDGLAQRFAVDAPQWAESAPLARFRLSGSSLYRLGSSDAAAFVDRFDLEVTQ